jgi:hypothetical protein
LICIVTCFIPRLLIKPTEPTQQVSFGKIQIYSGHTCKNPSFPSYPPSLLVSYFVSPLYLIPLSHQITISSDISHSPLFSLLIAPPLCQKKKKDKLLHSHGFSFKWEINSNRQWLNDALVRQPNGPVGAASRAPATFFKIVPILGSLSGPTYLLQAPGPIACAGPSPRLVPPPMSSSPCLVNTPTPRWHQKVGQTCRLAEGQRVLPA